MAKKKSPKKAASSISSYKPFRHSFDDLKPGANKYVVLGIWTLIIAVLASIMLAIVETPYLALILIAAGFIVGFLNFEHEEPVKLIVATIGLLVVASAVILTGFTRLEIVAPVAALYLKRASYNVISVTAPAAFVISIKALKELAQ